MAQNVEPSKMNGFRGFTILCSFSSLSIDPSLQDPSAQAVTVVTKQRDQSHCPNQRTVPGAGVKELPHFFHVKSCKAWVVGLDRPTRHFGPAANGC